MPGVEVLDEAGIPLLIDRYPVNQRYQGLQLYQRGIYWKTLQGSLIHRITSRTPVQLFNEWQSGFEVSRGINEQIERELDARLLDSNVRYLDFFTGDFDHAAHLSNDTASQYAVLKKIDALAGRLWTAIQSSPLARDTIFVLVSDHGMNTDPSIYSQGYSLVNFFNSAEGGGHHVITDRHPLTEFKLKGLDPFVSEVTTPSAHSFYLRYQADEYPTVLLDLDGNERASVHLRNNHLNELQMLLQQLARKDLPKEAHAAALKQFFDLLDELRPTWDRELREMNEELGAVRREIARQTIAAKDGQPNWTRAEREAGLDRDERRQAARLRSWQEDYSEYSQYYRELSKLLGMEAPQLDPSRLHNDDLIPKHAMGDRNTIYDLQNYAVAPGRRVDYFKLLTSIRVRNNVQPGVGNRPIDFIATQAPDNAIWLYESETSQALIYTRPGGDLRYQPVSGLTQDRDGKLHFSEESPRAGFPLHLCEDPELNVGGDRADWLTRWHTEREWLEATHRTTTYSNAIIGLEEQLSPIKLASCPYDDQLLCRFEQRKRDNVQADMLILASNHWNFNVRGFNPGGNHGSFFRISTHAVLMLAGAGIPEGLQIERPYDSLSFVPTLLSLTGAKSTVPTYPGPVIEELLPAIPPAPPSQ